MKIKRYWLRGGVGGVLLLFLLVMYFAVMTLVDGEWGHCGDMGCSNGALFLGVFIVSAPVFFILGSFFGFLYGVIYKKITGIK